MARDRKNLVIIGHGAAGLAAAVMAAEQAARLDVSLQITVLEKSPEGEAGGNTRCSPSNMRLDAIDRIAPDRAPYAEGLARYVESDLLCYRADSPAELVARQRAAWDPLLDWAQRRYDVHFSVTAGIVHTPQPEATVARLAEAVAARTAFELAGLSPVVTVTGSLVAALALLEGAADAATVWRAAEVDEDWQAEQWGEDDLARRARDAHRADFDAGARFLSLLRV